MAVTDNFQSRGVGRMLMNKAIDFAKNKKAKTIELDTSRKLEKAMRLYGDFGFKISDEAATEEYQRCTIKMSLDLYSVFFLLVLLSTFFLYGTVLINRSEQIAWSFPVLHMVEWIKQVSLLLATVIP